MRWPSYVFRIQIGAAHKLRHAEGGEGGISQCDDVYKAYISIGHRKTRGGGGDIMVKNSVT